MYFSVLQNEMSTLKADNERLQKMVVTSKANSPTSPEPTSSIKSSMDDLEKAYNLAEHASNIGEYLVK